MIQWTVVIESYCMHYFLVGKSVRGFVCQLSGDSQQIDLALIFALTHNPFNLYVTRPYWQRHYSMKCVSSLKFNSMYILFGCNAEMYMHTNILCSIIVILRKLIPFVISAIPLVKNSCAIVYEDIVRCFSLLTPSQLGLSFQITTHQIRRLLLYS